MSRFVGRGTKKPVVVVKPFKSTPGSSNGSGQASTSSLVSLAAPSVADQGDRRMSEFWAAEDMCPLCKSDRQLMPKLRLMVSRCYHKMCESCIDRIFSLGPEPCPVCGQILRKAHFTSQTFENLAVQKEVVIRQRIAKCFNKRPEDFIDLRSYNDYLEEVEDITFNLINAVDLVTTESRIKAYEAENRELIAANLTRLAEENNSATRLAEEEQRAKEENKLEFAQLDEADRIARERERKNVLESLESSTISTAAILERARESATLRASNLAAPTSLRYLSNLASSAPAAVIAPVDILADLNRYDSGDWLYDLQSAYASQSIAAPEPIAGGFVQGEVWSKAIREAVASLWEPPLDAMSSDGDIVMA